MNKHFTFSTNAIGIILLLVSNIVFSQEPIDAYKVEADGYFMHPVNTTAGVIVTDNDASKIWLIKNKELKEIAATPGCGRYFTVSPDGSKIGFKLIHPDGMQVPAIYDLSTDKTLELSTPVKLCGQVSFSNNGKIAFTIGNELDVVDSVSRDAMHYVSTTYDLGVYSNIAPISPDGNYVIYNNDHDQLFIMDLAAGNVETQCITSLQGNKCGYFYPQWSPDGNKVLYSTLSGNIMIWDKANNTSYSIGSGENVSWSDNSQYIIFNRTSIENFKFKGSDIYLAKFDGSKTINITNTPDVNEISPSFGPNKTFVYSTFDKKEIISATLNMQNFLVSDSSVLFKFTSQLLLNNNSSGTLARSRNINSIVMVSGDVPYIHQVYDTPTWHSGYSSCAPTTAAMALAYYNRLPKWPTVVNHGHSWDPHTSNYGSYVADAYRYNGTYYNSTADDYGGNTSWGGYGYMWTGSYSPNSRMAIYIQNQNITSIHSDTTTFAGAKYEINHNFPFPICNTLSTAGHLTLAVGYVNGQHTLIFNDPYGNKDSVNTIGWPNYYGKNAYYDWPGYSNGFQNLNTVAWTASAESTQLTYNDTIVDDVNYNHGFYMYNQSIALMKYYHDSETGGYGAFSHYWWTYTSTSTTVDTCYVSWTPALASTGNYQVYTYIPSSGATATAARYKVFYDGGNTTVVINQASHLGQWVSLGTFPFLQGSIGYVRLGDGAGNLGQVIAFDAVKWNFISPLYTDTVPPQTAINVSGTWQTQDFTTNFTDADDLNGSGLEKSFYTVAAYNGSQWHGNAQRGFITDNYVSIDTSWKVPALSGTWNILNSTLVQTDTTINNSNIYTALNQGLSNRYIYHFKAMMSAATYSSNQHRFGIHFFSDTASLSNRGNSYFIFFRQETHRMEFYKVLNNAFTMTKVDSNVVTSFGQWYDYKIIFDRISGKIDVYRNNILLDSWTDTSPLTTAGNYISFRTGNAKVYFDSLEVFRSRYPSATITVGAAAANDIHYQNTNPSTSSGLIRSICNDSIGNFSGIVSHYVNIDWTDPVCTTVNDGTNADIDTTTSLTTLSANWTTSTDPNSGIAKYRYAIGTTQGNTDIVSWTDNGLNTSVTNSGLSLTNAQHYYFSIKTEDGAGLISICNSDGVYTDINVGLQDYTELSDVNIFPNPATNNITIESQTQATIEIYNIRGQLIKTLSASSKKISQQTDLWHVDISALPGGVYFVEVKTEKGVGVRKFVKE